jgi:hypothetical protein
VMKRVPRKYGPSFRWCSVRVTNWCVAVSQLLLSHSITPHVVYLIPGWVLLFQIADGAPWRRVRVAADPGRRPIYASTVFPLREVQVDVCFSLTSERVEGGSVAFF